MRSAVIEPGNEDAFATAVLTTLLPGVAVAETTAEYDRLTVVPRLILECGRFCDSAGRSFVVGFESSFVFSSYFNWGLVTNG